MLDFGLTRDAVLRLHVAEGFGLRAHADGLDISTCQHADKYDVVAVAPAGVAGVYRDLNVSLGDRPAAVVG